MLKHNQKCPQHTCTHKPAKSTHIPHTSWRKAVNTQAYSLSSLQHYKSQTKLFYTHCTFTCNLASTHHVIWWIQREDNLTSYIVPCLQLFWRCGITTAATLLVNTYTAYLFIYWLYNNADKVTLAWEIIEKRTVEGQHHRCGVAHVMLG